MRKRAAEIKKRLDVPIIVGGPHPTYFPMMVEADNIDIIARGESENVILELMNRLRDGRPIHDISGLWVKQGGVIYKNSMAPLVEKIDEIPFPDRRIYEKYKFFEEETEFPLTFSRGCPYNCTFCYNAAKKKLYAGQKTVRLRSADNIISEINLLRQAHPHFKSIVFQDDNLGADPNWFEEFYEKYSKINPPAFITSIRADFINEDRAKKLKKMNCYCLSIGVESGDRNMREKILQKYILDETYIRAARFLRENGIKVRTSNMFFLPGETIEMALKTMWLNKKMKADHPWAYALQPYPGTAIYQYAVDNGFLGKNFSFDDIDPLGILEGPIAPNLKDGDKIKVIQRLFYYGVKFPGFIHLMKLLVHIPNNFIFDLLHQLALFISFATSHQLNIFRAFKVVYRAKKVGEKKWV